MRIRQGIRRLLDKRHDRRSRRAERAHVQDIASQGQGDASTKHWRPSGP